MDGLTGGQFGAFNRYINAGKGDYIYGIGDMFQELFSQEGLTAVRQTLGTVVSSALGNFG